MMTPDQQKKIIAEVDEVLKLMPTHGNGQWKSKLLIKDSIADITLQQVLTRAKDFDVIATLNLNGDYLSDALAAQVGGIGIAPGANINYITGHAIFEATHGTAPKYANLDQVNPGSVILSGEMMLRYMGWGEAADLIVKGLEGAITAKTVTYDFGGKDGVLREYTYEIEGTVVAQLQFYLVKSEIGLTFTYTQLADRLKDTRAVAEKFFTGTQVTGALEALMRPSTIRG